MRRLVADLVVNCTGRFSPSPTRRGGGESVQGGGIEHDGGNDEGNGVRGVLGGERNEE